MKTETTVDAWSAVKGRDLYFLRCGWCGAYDGTVDPDEPCAKDETGYIGPHQFGVYERAPDLSAAPDLLEALEIIAGMDVPRNVSGERRRSLETRLIEWRHDVVEVAREAVQKATGAAP